MRRDLVVGGLAFAALIAVSMLGHQPESPKSATHASADFSFGGYRAWYDVLQREGVTVTRFRRHHDALSQSGIDTLIVAFPDRPAASLWDAAERDALRAWVRGGGRLIDIGETPRAGAGDGKDDPVVIEDTRDTRGARGALRGPWTAWIGSIDRGKARLVPPPRPKRAKHAKNAKNVKRVSPAKPVKPAHVETLLADGAGALVVRYRFGRGEVVGVANAASFENRALAHGDDARLAFLVARAGRGGVVAFDEAVRGDIVEKAWYRALDAPELVALAIAGSAGLLWLLYGIVPLGPAVRLRATREPTSEEFVDAVAALYERARARDHARDALVADARRALEHAPRTADNVALARRVAAAHDEPLANDAALIAVAKLARTAREEIIRGSSPDRRPGTFARGFGARRRRR